MSASLPLLGSGRPRHSVEKSGKGCLKILESAEATFLQDVVSALEDAHIPQASAAAYMRISETQLSKQLRAVGHEHLSARRLGLLPSEFHEAFNIRRARRYNQHCQSAQKRREKIQAATATLLGLLTETA